MASHGFPWNPRAGKVERSKRHREARFDGNAPLHDGLHLPTNVQAWLDTMPGSFRYDAVSCLDELGDQVVFGQLRDSFARTNLKLAVEYVVDLARSYVEGVHRERFVEVILREPRLVELGLLMSLSQLSQTQEIPRDQEFYPAVLFDREVLSVIKHVAERDQPAVALLWKLVCLHDGDLTREIEESLADVERGFARTTRWPSSDVSGRLCVALARVKGLWESLARGLFVATQQSGGTLPMFAVEDAAKPFEMVRAERVLMVENINRRRQRRCPVDLLRMAMDWPNRASSILGNLAGEFGSLRLYSAYVQAIWSSVLGAAQESQIDAATFLEHGAEVLERDIAYPIFAGVEPLEDVVTLFEEACSYDLVRKKRLSRQRERCLRSGLVVVDPDWVDLLRDIGSSYWEVEEAVVSAAVVGRRVHVSRGDKRVVVE